MNAAELAVKLDGRKYPFGLTKQETVDAKAAGLVVAYGASDEFHQLFVACRSCDVFDLMADIAGGTIGAVFYGRYKPF